MNRDDVIDVLTVVAAGDRRSVGQADVEVWFAAIGDEPKDLAIEAVGEHRRLRPGVWLEPGYVYQRVRAISAERAQRESTSERQAREDQHDARFGDAPAIEASPRGDDSAPSAYRVADAIERDCPNPKCSAVRGDPCRTPTGDVRRIPCIARVRHLDVEIVDEAAS